MIKAVIFDVDGTLLDTETIYMRAWREAAAVFGYPMPDEALKKTRAIRAAIAIPIFREYCGADFPYEDVRVERVRIAEEIIGASSPEELCKPFARQLLDLLRARSIPMAVASSTGKQKTIEHLLHAGLLDYFCAIVGGDMVSRGKPEPDIFLKAAALMGIPPQDCLVVGDSPADVFSGSAAGMQIALIPDAVPANDQTTALSWKVLPDLQALWDVLKAELSA